MNPKPKKIISRAAAMLLTVIMAFAGAQTAGAQGPEQKPCKIRFDISGEGTVVFREKTVTNRQPIDFLIPSSHVLTITPETGYVLSSVTYDAPDWLSIILDQDDDFQWNLNIKIHQYEGPDTPTITVHIVFNKTLAGGADESSAVALTADDDLSRLTGGWYKVVSDLTIGHTVNLLGDTHIIIASGATLTVNTSDDYGIYGSALTVEYGISDYALTVSGEGTLNVSASNRAISVDNYTQTGCAVTLSGDIDGLIAENNVSISGGSLTTRAYYGIDTNIGSITISGGTVSSSGDRAGLYAGDAVSITGGTVSASGDDYGIIGYSVSITGGQVTASSVGIWSRVGDITLGWTSATDYITASGYFLQDDGQHVKIADGQTLYGGGFPSASFTGTVDDPSALNGLMLRPTAAVTESGTNEYTIWNADGWDAFCDRLAADDGKAFFSGKTVKLGANIEVTRMAGSQYHDFCGTFDGGGHTLTFSHTATDNYCAPFRTVQGATAQTPAVISNLNVVSTVTADDYRHPAGLIALQSGYVSVTDCNVEAHINCTKGTVNTSDLYPAALVSQSNNTGVLTVSGCTTTGQIATDGKYAAGLVGIVQGTATITDCLSSVTINSSTAGDGTHGGIVALNSGTLSINGCVFDGKLLSTGTNATTNCGGFVGYGNGTITNSLYAPADLGTGETEVQTGDVNNHPSATFARDNATVTNSYYTRTLGTPQGKQLRTIAAGEGVTLGHDGVATEYSVSGITAYKASGASGDDDSFIAGIIYNNVLYAGSGDEVSLTLTNSSGEAPLGYYYPYSVGAGTLSGSTLTMPDEDVTVNTAALRSTGVAVPVSYVDAYGNTQTAQSIALDGTETDTVLGRLGEETWYFVGADIAFDQMLNLSGDVNLILADGSTMNVTSDFNGIEVGVSLTIYGQTDGTGTLNATGDNGAGINTNGGTITISGGRVTATSDNSTGIYINSSGNLTISGGRVTATSDNGNGIYTDSGNITISGGWVTATSDNGVGIYIYNSSGNLTISGGRVSATGGEGIYTDSGTITLGCTTASDFIYVSIYVVGRDGRLNIADGQTLFDEDGNEYSGNGVNIPAGKTLRPYDCRLALSDDADNTAAIADANGKVYNVTLQGRKLYKDGAWNTLCLPFALGDEEAESGHELDGTPLEGATLMTLGNSQACNTGFDPQTGTLNLDFLPATTVEPGVAYIVKWPIPDGMTADEFAAAYAANPDDYDLKNPVFTGVTVTNDAPADHATTSLDGYVTFIGTYSPIVWETENNSVLFLGSGNTLYFPQPSGSEKPHVNAFRGYFQLKGLTASEVSLARMNFDEQGTQNGIGHTEITEPTVDDRRESQITERADAAWYSLDGVKLDSKPSSKGIYIHGNKKVVVE